MKTIILNVILTLMVGFSAFCQLKLNETGRVGIGGEPADDCAAKVTKCLTGLGNNYGITALFAPGSTSNMLYATSSSSYRSTAASQGRTTGILGIAGNATYGWNYGVYGRILGSQGGAAIFGTIPGRGQINVGSIYAGYFRGNVKVEDVLYVNTTIYPSDITRKKDIREFENNILDKLMQLNPIRYRLKSPLELGLIGPEVTDTMSTPLSLTDREAEIYNRERFGLSAQEVQKQFPEIVIEGDDGFLGIDYTELIPILIEALKDQQRQINDLQNNGGKAGFNIKSLNEVTSGTASADDDILQNTTLYQNNPNPFNQVTTIRFVIPEKVNQAMLYIYNMQGMQIQSHKISDRGHSALEIQGAVLNPGMYLYTLIADGRAIDTKRMILTDN